MKRVLLIGGVGDGVVTDCLPGSATVVFGSPEGVSIYECKSVRMVIADHTVNLLVGIEHNTPRDQVMLLAARGLLSEAVAKEVCEGRIEVKPISGVRDAGLGRSRATGLVVDPDKR